MRKIATFLAFLGLLTVMATPAVGQVPGFPQTLAPNTVVGRLGIGPGPAQAIPFATLRTQMIGSVPAGSTTVTGGSILRSNSDRWVDNWMSAPEIGVDCTGVADSTAAIQAFFEDYRTGGTSTGKLMFPSSCLVQITDTIVMGSMSGAAISGPFFAGDGAFFDTPNLSSPHIYWRGTNGGAACTAGGGDVACKYMFDFTNNDHPIVQNISFNMGGNLAAGYQCADGFLRFDGDGGTFTPTNGQIVGNSFNGNNCRLNNFVAVNIAPTSTNNHENYVVNNNVIACGGNGGYQRIASDGVTNGTTTLTSATAPFVAGYAPKTVTAASWAAEIATFTMSTSVAGLTVDSDVVTISGVTPAAYNGNWVVASVSGNSLGVYITQNPGAYVSGGTKAGARIRISYAGGSVDTTVATFVSSSNITLASAPAWSQSNVRVIAGSRGFGVGLRNGASQNAIQQQFSKIQYSTCSVGIQVQGGGAQITQPSSGASDTGVLIGGFLAQNTTVDFYASESDIVGIQINAGAVPPISITNGRFSNAEQSSDGFIKFGSSNVYFWSNTFNFNPPTNSVLTSSSGAFVTSINNQFHNASWTTSGYSAITNPAPSSINDIFDGGLTAPGTQIYGCYAYTIPCLSITNSLSTNGGIGFDVNTTAVNLSSSVYGAKFRAALSNTGGTWQGVQVQGATGRVTSQTLFEAAWNVNAIDAAAPMTAGYGYRARTPSSVSGTLADLYGVYIDQQKVANVTNGWGVYQADSGDKNAFLGGVQLGVSSLTTPTGTLGFAKVTDAGTAAGAAGGKIMLRCGTNAGTARLIAYAGTSTTPVTILDNIGSGVTGC